jgi:hypothetical protein
MTNPELFRTKSNFFYAGMVQVAAAMISLLALLNDPLPDSITTLAWASFASFTAYLIFIRPKITFFDEGLQIINPFNEILVGWHEVQDIDNRFSLSITVEGERFYAWAAPAPSRYGSRAVHPSELKGMSLGDQGSIRAADNPRSLSGAAAYLARLRFQEFQNNPPTSRITKQVSFNTIGVIALLGLLSFTLGWMAMQR